jgi:hypothetical protein
VIYLYLDRYSGKGPVTRRTVETPDDRLLSPTGDD